MFKLYKIDPVSCAPLAVQRVHESHQTIFWTWLRILSRVRHSILWLLRFPAPGEVYLLQTAIAWAGPEIASRIRFTDVVPKETHIARCCVADLILDTAEVRLISFPTTLFSRRSTREQCSAHTIAAEYVFSRLNHSISNALQRALVGHSDHSMSMAKS